MNKDTKIVKAVCIVMCFIGFLAVICIASSARRGNMSELNFWIWYTICFVIMLASVEIYDKMDEIEDGRE